jgi:hypothetical protein
VDQAVVGSIPGKALLDVAMSHSIGSHASYLILLLGGNQFLVISNVFGFLTARAKN